MQEKRCPRCKETKPITEFGKDRRNKDDLNIYCKACKKLYNDEQKEYRSNYMRIWHQTHPKSEDKLEHDREYSRSYRKNHPEYRRKNNNNYRARLANSMGSITPEDIDLCLEFFKMECAYTGVPLTCEYQLDHIIPISKNGSSDIFNLVPCLPIVNQQKHIKDFEEWYPKQSFYSESRYLKIKEWMKKGEV